MANPGARSPQVPTPPRGVEIASFGTYLEAQQAVDYLADKQFTVQAVTIVGSDLRMVERITGRLSYARVAFAGAASGAWFGVFVGLLLSLVGGSNPLLAILPAVAIGAAFGMLFGVASYAFTGGKRDFTSNSQIVASRYSVLCLPEVAGEARVLLSSSPGGTGRPGATVDATAGSPTPVPTSPQATGTPPPASTEPPRYGARLEE